MEYATHFPAPAITFCFELVQTGLVLCVSPGTAELVPLCIPAKQEQDGAWPALLAALEAGSWSITLHKWLHPNTLSRHAPTMSAQGCDFGDLWEERCHRTTGFINTVEACQP